MDKTCLDCGTLIKGRADKKFCDDQCRSNYNNRLKSDGEGPLKSINVALKKNRSILEKLNPDGKAKTTRTKLTQAGFNFNFITSIYETQKGQIYKFCYEYGYLALENDWFLLVKKEEV